MDGGEEDGKKESPFDDSVHAFVLGFVDGDILLGEFFCVNLKRRLNPSVRVV